MGRNLKFSFAGPSRRGSTASLDRGASKSAIEGTTAVADGNNIEI